MGKEECELERQNKRGHEARQQQQWRVASGPGLESVEGTFTTPHRTHPSVVKGTNFLPTLNHVFENMILSFCCLAH